MNRQAALIESIKFTYEDYLHFPQDKRYEIIDGEAHMVPAPVPYHQEVLGNLYARLREFGLDTGHGKVYLAPCDVVLSEVDVVQPDILFICTERLNIVTEGNVEGAPDLIVEIISPSSGYRDRTIKRKLYSKYGVKEYWLVEPERREIEVMALTESGLEVVEVYREEDVLESVLLKGLSVELDRIF